MVTVLIERSVTVVDVVRVETLVTVETRVDAGRVAVVVIMLAVPDCVVVNV